MRNTPLLFRFLIVLAFGSQIVSATADEPVSGSDAKTALKVFAESYLEYRASFPNLKVSFQWTAVKANSPVQALRGEFTERGEPVECLVIVAAGRRRYEFLCGAQSQAGLAEAMRGSRTQEGGGLVMMDCLSFMLLESDGYALRYTVSGGSANLFVPEGQINDGVRVSPFCLDTMGSDEASNPAWYLNNALGGRFQYEYLGSLEADRPDLTVAVISDILRNQFSFDPTRAYLLSQNVRTDVKTSRCVHEMRVLDAVECSDGRWLPDHAVVVFFPDEPDKMRIFEMKVLEHDANYNDVPSDWELELPPNLQISVAGEVQWTRTSADRPERFQPSDFPSLYERCVAKGKQYQERRQQSAELAKGQNTGNSSRQFFYGINVALALTVGFYFLWRWRRNVKSNGKNE